MDEWRWRALPDYAWKRMPFTRDVIAELKGQIASAEEERDALIRERDELKAQIAILQEQVRSGAGGQGLSGGRRAPRPLEDTLAKSEADSSDRTRRDEMIILLGDGLCFMAPDLRRRLAARWELAERSKPLWDLIAQAESEGLIALHETSTRGNPQLVGLTTAGCAAYRDLTGHEALLPAIERLMERHVSADHTALNIRTAEGFRALGCTVDMDPVEAEGAFQPDLKVLTPDEEILFIEAETGKSHRSLEGTLGKWDALAQGGGGIIHIVVPDEKVHKLLRKEIKRAKVEGLAFRLARLAVVDDLFTAAEEGRPLATVWHTLSGT
jgi:hypothetical protein